MSIASCTYSFRSYSLWCIPRSESIDWNFLRSRLSPSGFVSTRPRRDVALLRDARPGCRDAGGPRTTARSRRCGERQVERTGAASASPPTPGSAAPCSLSCSPSDLPEHLDAAPRVVGVLALEVPVVERQRLLELRRVRLLRQRHHRHVVVAHVVAADLVRPVGQAVRMRVVGRPQQAAAPSSAHRTRRRRRRRRTAPPSRRPSSRPPR